MPGSNRSISHENVVVSSVPAVDSPAWLQIAPHFADRDRASGGPQQWRPFAPRSSGGTRWTTQPGARDLDRRIPPLYGCCCLRGYRFRDRMESDPGPGLLPDWGRIGGRVFALGELYLLLPVACLVTPGISLLIVAVAARGLERADPEARLTAVGWQALERGPFLVALAATINAGGDGACRRCPVLGLDVEGGGRFGSTSGRLRADRSRDGRCRSGQDAVPVWEAKYLYLAMVLGIAIIFAGVVLTRQPQQHKR